MDMPAAASLRTGAVPAHGFSTLLRMSFSSHCIFFVVALGYLIAFQMTGAPIRSGTEGIIGITLFSIPMALFALAQIKFFQIVIHEKPAKPITALWRNITAVLKSRERMAVGLPMFMALLVFMYAYTMMKANIESLTPFSWDQTFDRWDEVLHFGVRPWQLLHPVLGYWPMTFLLNFNYNLWFIIMNVFWVYYAFVASPGIERSRFFIAFMLIWMVGGGILAVYFSSAGPCYFTRLGLSPDPYAGLMHYLRLTNNIVPIWAIDTQDLMWEFHINGSALASISAMPSMHNATALLFILTTWNQSKWLRSLVIGHGALIFVGSIHLGWHYAVDSYLAWILTGVLWLVAHRLAKWWEARPQSTSFAAALAVGSVSSGSQAS